MTTSTTIDHLSLANLARDEVRANPYPLYRVLRENEPVRWDEPLGCWVLTRYADISALLQDRRMSVQRFKRLRQEAGGRDPAVDELLDLVTHMMNYVDPPNHTRLRNLTNRAFTPKVLETLRGKIQNTVDELIDGALAEGFLDLVEGYAYPLTTIMIGSILGIPREHWLQLKKWEDDLSGFLGRVDHGPEEMRTAAASVRGYFAYFQRVVEERRRNPGDDLLTNLIEATEEEGRLTEFELFSTCQLFMMAGHAAASHLVSNGLLSLMRHPDQLHLLRANPGLTRHAVEEAARWDSSAQVVERIATEDVVIGGRTIAAGDTLRLVLGAAHRDPERFPDPDRLDIQRPNHRALLFGGGPHTCIGAMLALMEGEVAFETLLRRIPEFTLGIRIEELEWLPTHSLHGVRTLPIFFCPQQVD